MACACEKTRNDTTLATLVLTFALLWNSALADEKYGADLRHHLEELLDVDHT